MLSDGHKKSCQWLIWFSLQKEFWGQINGATPWVEKKKITVIGGKILSADQSEGLIVITQPRLWWNWNPNSIFNLLIEKGKQKQFCSPTLLNLNCCHFFIVIVLVETLPAVIFHLFVFFFSPVVSFIYNFFLVFNFKNTKSLIWKKMPHCAFTREYFLPRTLVPDVDEQNK